MSSTELLEAFAAFEAGYEELAKLVQEHAWQLLEAELVDLTRRLHTQTSKAQGLQLRLVQDVEARGVPATAGATSLTAWLIRALRLSPGAAKSQAKLAPLLQGGKCADTGAALAAGAVNYEQAAAIARTIAALPSKASAEDARWAEGFLLEHAAHLNAADLARLAKRIDAAIDPDGTADREKAATERRAANIRDNFDGTQTLTWRDTDEHVAALKAAMVALAAPSPAADGVRDERAPEIRRADAMREIVRQAMQHGDLPRSRGERPRLTVTASVDVLRTGTGFGRTESGEDVSGPALRRIACDAEVFAVVMTRRGAPLRMGRRVRTVTPTQWVALCARDTGCVFPGCQRPASFCDAHHIVHWADGGPTDLDNLALVCGRHHDAIHHEGWDLLLGLDRRPWLRPPPWADPERLLIRNTYWDTPDPRRT